MSFLQYSCFGIFAHVNTGMANQVLTYVGDQIILNYTSGEICHKVYERSTNIYFSCNPDRNPVSLTHRKSAPPM